MKNVGRKQEVFSVDTVIRLIFAISNNSLIIVILLSSLSFIGKFDFKFPFYDNGKEKKKKIAYDMFGGKTLGKSELNKENKIKMMFHANNERE